MFQPGGWLDTGPYGCLGNGLGYSMAARVARPDAQIVTLLGDGAAGFSLMDADSLVRQGLPVVMVVGNNGMWGLEKHPMQAIYGWDVACDLQPGCRYDEVVAALGGGGELVTDPEEVGPALDRASPPASRTSSTSSPTPPTSTPAAATSAEPIEGLCTEWSAGKPRRTRMGSGRRGDRLRCSRRAGRAPRAGRCCSDASTPPPKPAGSSSWRS